MVRPDGVDHFRFFLEFLGQFHADDCVRQFRFVVGHLADIVQQAGATGHLGVQSQFRGHDAAQIGHFARVLQQVLSVRRTVFHLTDQADQFGMEPVDAQVDRGALAGFDDLFFDLFLYFGNDFFDACRMDAAVRYQLVQRQTRDFTAYRIEARQDDRFRRVVDDDLDAGSGFQGPDVPSFAADDPAFHFVALDVEHRDRVFDGRFGSDALDRLYDDLFRLLVGAHLGLFHHFVDIGHRFGLGLLFHVFDQDVLGFVATEAADLFETGVLFLDFAVEVFLLAFDALDLSLQTLAYGILFADFLVQLVLLLGQVVFQLFGALFALGELLVALVDGPVVFAFELDEFFLGLENLLLFDHLAGRFGLFQNRGLLVPDDFRCDRIACIAACGGTDDGNYCYNYNAHRC